MKGACIVTKSDDFFAKALNLLSCTELDCRSSDDRLQVIDQNGRIFTLFQLTEEIEEFDESDLLRTRGYIFEYLVDCRWEDLFCDIVKGLADGGITDFQIIDTSGSVYKPHELSEHTLIL